MRYRVLEENREDGWVPVTTIFEVEGQVHRFRRGRSPFARVDAPSLERVSLEDLPYDEAEFRLGPVASAEFPEHELQRRARALGESIRSEFLEENHFELLARFRRGGLAG